MKIRGLLIAVAVFVVLAGTLYWSDHHKPSTSVEASADSPPPILHLDEGAITQLEIKKKDAPPIVLVKPASGSWQITQPKSLGADQSTVSSTLSTLSSLDSERLVEDRASDLKRYGLDSPALQVNVTGKDNKTQNLLIGDDTPTGAAVYAMLAGQLRVFTMASYNKSSLDKSLDDLRDKRLLTIPADKMSRIELMRKSQEIELGRNQDAWQILKPRPLRADNVQVTELATKLAGARMELGSSSADPAQSAAAFAHATPLATAKITAPSGTQQIEVRKGKDDYYAKSSVVEGIYRVGADLGHAVEESLDDFRNKKLFDFGFADPTRIEIRSGAKNNVFTRKGEDWQSNNSKLDSDTVQSLVSKVRDLAASKFVDSGFATPLIELTVTSEDGKRVERVLISKSGNRSIARRENEPAQYELEPAAVDELLKAADEVKPAVPSKK
jgi:Domain of unknown function (DUF4340)